MAKQIIWSRKAQNELVEIFEYWINRNKSNVFAVKLNSLIQEQSHIILEYPKIGRKTDIENVYIKVIHKYLLYYEFVDGNLHILTIRYGGRDPETLKIK